MTETLIVILIFGGFFIILLGWLIFLQMKVRSIVKKNESLFADVKSGDVIQILNATLKELEVLNKKYETLENEHKGTNSLAKKSFHKLGIKRFNPFNDTGGDQSFSLALLDHYNNGFVVTSIHGRDGNRIYAKPIENNDSSYNLAEEEKDVIKTAINSKVTAKKHPLN